MELKIDLDSSVSVALEEAATKALEKAIHNQTRKEKFSEWMDLKTGAKYANVSYTTFIKFRKMGLQVCEIEGVKRVSKTEIDRFLKGNSY